MSIVIRIGLAAAALGHWGCISDISAPHQTLWEAQLAGGLAQPLATGNAAAVSGAATDVGLEVDGLEPGTYVWSIRAGSCEAPGDVLGAEGVYPELVAGAEEPVSAEARTSALMVSGGSYHAEIRGPDSGEIAACGNFEQIG